LIDDDGDEPLDVDDGGGLRPDRFVGGLLVVEGNSAETGFFSTASLLRARFCGSLVRGGLLRGSLSGNVIIGRHHEIAGGGGSARRPHPARVCSGAGEQIVGRRDQ
jgi:hypothetical protein